MRRQLLAALAMVGMLTVLCGVLYPLATTAVTQVAFSDQADGSLIYRDGELVGSSLLAQGFEGDEYFHPRPSAAGDGYDPTASAASNLGPTNPDLASIVEERAAAYRAANDLPSDDPVPVDAVTASASGLDPHISIANARIQATRVAAARSLSLEVVLDLVVGHTAERALAVLGEDAVNVLELNLALDALN